MYVIREPESPQRKETKRDEKKQNVLNRVEGGE